MAGLFYIFDSPFSFRENEYYFRYQGIVFKLVNGGDLYPHYLATVAPEIHHPTHVDRVALEFLACLALDANMPVVYKGTFGTSSYDEALFRNSEIRNVVTARSMPLHVINHQLPKSLPNLSNKRKKFVIAMYQESLISMRALPHYTFLNYWKILSILEGNDHLISEKIWKLLGKEFFEKMGHPGEQDAKVYLKELRNRIGHTLGRGWKDVCIIDPEIYFEICELTHALWHPILRAVRDFLAEKPLLLFNNKNTDTPVYMTDEQFYKSLS